MKRNSSKQIREKGI